MGKEFEATPEELTALQRQAIILLSSGKTVTETAEEIGVERETVSRWKNHDAMFAALLSYQQAALWDAAADKLRATVLKAAGALDDLLDHDDPNVQLKAIAIAYKALTAYPKNGRVRSKSVSSIERDWSFRDF